ncbi:hypothetical protein [Lactobacillus amylovorus]
MNNDDVKKVVRQAISVGYRAFDTARDYGNQNSVGKGIWIPMFNAVIYV